MAQGGVQETSSTEKCAGRKILVLGPRAAFSVRMMDYAIHLAGRLDCHLLVLSVDTEWEGESFRRRAAAAAKGFRQKAEALGIDCAFLSKQGNLESAVEDLKREEKRIEFVLADEGIDREEVGRKIALPIFSVLTNRFERDGGEQMANKQEGRRTKPAAKTIVFGILSAALYAAVFMNMDLVMEYFTRGGVYAALPICTALIFSFAHSAFAGNVYSFLGIEAARKGVLRETEKKVLEKKKQARKKPRAYAYINPFHRI